MFINTKRCVYDYTDDNENNNRREIFVRYKMENTIGSSMQSYLARHQVNESKKYLTDSIKTFIVDEQGFMFLY